MNDTSRPIQIISILKESFAFYKANFIFLFSISFLAEGLFLIEPFQQVLPQWVNALLVFARIFIVFWGHIALIYGVSSRFNHQDIGIKKTFVFAKSKIWLVFQVSVVQGLLIIFGFLLLILPAFYWWTVFSLSILIVVLDDAGVMDSLRGSKNLIRGYFWPVFGVYLILFVILSPLYAIYSQDILYRHTLFYFLSILLLPWATAINFHIYQKLKSIKGPVSLSGGKKGLGPLGCLGVSGLYFLIIFLVIIGIGKIFGLTNMFKEGKFKSVEIVSYGVVKMEDVRKKTGQDIPKNLSQYLTKPHLMQATDEISSGLKTFFGIVINVQGHPNGAFVLLEVKFLHPPITDPVSGTVTASDEVKMKAYIGRKTPLGWIFDHEWEIVPGVWTIQILHNGDIVAEKKFNVSRAQDIFSGLGEAGTMIKQLQEAILRNPQDALTIKNLGNVYLGIGDNKSAIVEYTRAIAIKAEPNFFNNRCLAWNNEQEFEKALKDCNEALSINPAHTSALINRGTAFRLKGEYDKAIEDYNQSLKVAPAGDTYNPPMAYYNRALAYKAQKKFDLAILDIAKLIEMQPGNADAYDLRAEIYQAQGNRIQARTDYQKALQLKRGKQ